MAVKRCQSDDEVIRASEVDQFVFCSMAWYLKRQGYEPDPRFFEKGVTVHRRHGDFVSQVERWEHLSKWLLVVSGVLFFVGLLVLVVGVFL